MATISESLVTIVSTSTVRSPADQHLDRRVELSPLDLPLFLLGPIQEGLLFHRPKHDGPTDSLVGRLEASLSRTLHFFPPFSGRLSRTNNEDGVTASFFIDCNNVGARFVRATAGSVSVSDILGARFVPEVVGFMFPLNGAGNHEGVAKPLLAVQVTELVDGFFIGCTINHIVADGSSFWHFLNSWAEISRGLDAPTKPPSLGRWFPGGEELPVRIPLALLHQGENVDHSHGQKLPDLAERVFLFGKESVAKLKERANSEMGMDGRVSSLQALLAHIWRSIIRNRHIEFNDQEVEILFLIGARQRVQQLPEQYFGNAIQPVMVTMKASEVTGHGIGHVAWEMNKAIGSYTKKKIETALDHQGSHPVIASVKSEAELRNPFLVVSNSPRFDVYGNDFGWGRPVAIRCGPENKRDDRMALFPGVKNGDIEVHVRLLSQTLCAMEKDVEFMDIFV